MTENSLGTQRIDLINAKLAELAYKQYYDIASIENDLNAIMGAFGEDTAISVAPGENIITGAQGGLCLYVRVDSHYRIVAKLMTAEDVRDEQFAFRRASHYYSFLKRARRLS